jgi:uncharacterized protein YukE
MQFPAEAVQRHADAVNEAADGMAQARAAVGEITMDGRAYGQLCQFLPSLLSPLFGSASEAMNDAVDALGETALKLRATAANMTATDAGSASRLEAAARPALDLPL